MGKSWAEWARMVLIAACVTACGSAEGREPPDEPGTGGETASGGTVSLETGGTGGAFTGETPATGGQACASPRLMLSAQCLEKLKPGVNILNFYSGSTCDESSRLWGWPVIAMPDYKTAPVYVCMVENNHDGEPDEWKQAIRVWRVVEAYTGVDWYMGNFDCESTEGNNPTSSFDDWWVLQEVDLEAVDFAEERCE